MRSSAARASSIACSATSVTMALTWGLMASIRARNSATISRAEIRRSRSCRARSVAGCCQIVKSLRDAAGRKRNAGCRQTHLDARKRAGKHEIVEVAEMADPEYFSFQLAETRSE